MLQPILEAYGLDEDKVKVKAFGTGLINHTWLVEAGKEQLILQRINHIVLRSPMDIATNIKLIGEYLWSFYPDYRFVMPLKAINGEDMVYFPELGYFRIFPFVNHSHSIDVVRTVQQAYEAAVQFGRFTRLLSDFPSENLAITLPDFHNLSLRYTQFEEAVQHGNKERITQSGEMISYLKEQETIAALYNEVCASSNFKKRVTHHDTKISNVLFDDKQQGICVIDLDTVMPGYFISDLGDMMRTYLSPVNEEEKDFTRIEIRIDYFKAIIDGYLSEMKDKLTLQEKEYFVYAGKFMIYMQALRFLTDHLNNDAYYGAAYEGHNFVRAGNQVTLLKKLIEKEELLTGLLRDPEKVLYAKQDRSLI